MIQWVVFSLIALLAFVIVLTAFAHIRTSTPYGGTQSPVRDAMMRLAHLRGTETVYDIGAGDGRLLIVAKRGAPGIRAIGYENALGIWLTGRLRILLSRLDISLRLRDARKEDCSAADVIFLYLGPEMMRDLEGKFDRELRPGTLVISHSFTFPHHKLEREEAIPWRGRVRKVRMYRW